MDLPLVGIGEERVVSQSEEGLHRVGLPVRHCTKDLGRVGHVASHDLIDPGLAPDPLEVRSEEFGGPVGVDGMGRIAELLGPLLGRKCIVQLEFGLGPPARVEAVQHLAAHDVEVARDRTEDRLKSDARSGIQLLIGNRRPRDDGAVGIRVEARGLRDAFGVDSGESGDAFQRVLVDPCPQCIESDAPVTHEVGIEETFVQDDLRPAEEKSGIRAGADLEVERRLLCLLGDARVDHDDVRTLRTRCFDEIEDRRPGMLSRIVAQENDARCVANVRKRHPAVGEPIHRRGVPRAKGDARDPIGRPQEVQEAAVQSVGRLGIPTRRRHGHCLGPMRVDEGLEPLRDLVHRLLVGDLLPAVGATFADAFERHPETFGMVVDLWCGRSLEADVAGDGWRVVRQDPRQSTLLGDGAELASDVADRANRIAGAARGRGRCDGHGPDRPMPSGARTLKPHPGSAQGSGR